jgi:hypothetical protein
MQVTVTGQSEFIAKQPKFQALLKRCEEALANPITDSDPVNGMYSFVRVETDEDDYIREAIIELYKAAGWKWVSDRFIGELRFVLQDSD